ncbi:TetR/AcrR family transcriptional regulator [Parahaliea sp. F7430]|uniref:TetR/AcrR family transcriptional regulator n=1 Tax=Sediminihaliea albiluteola TaxID=2758564 RepID=A0A7W2TWD3_9GAMM|nr:TetR/AcrR family transcriptional regulator [Sediminihaliea albiluteola]MBA6413069.1 TetR/AcrR family transcriptional regulator [Sediminihaliea albiluteola]
MKVVKHAAQSREQRSLQVREAVLQAAIEVFAEKGFEGATLGEIASIAGVKQPLLVYHFTNKESLWEVAASSLMEKFNARQSELYQGEIQLDDRQRLLTLLKSFIYTLRELPAYGKLLLKEGSRISQRTQWLDQHFVPAIYRNAKFNDPRLQRIFGTVNLLRYVVAGGILYIVVAGPQLAVSAAEEGGIGDSPEELNPLSDDMVEQLANILCGMVFSQLEELPALEP